MGASPPFPPPPYGLDADAARQTLRQLVGRDPRCLGHDQTRWDRAALRASCPWLRGLSLSGVGGVLARLGIVWRRGQDHVHSPDPAYEAKQATIAAVVRQVQDQVQVQVQVQVQAAPAIPPTVTLFLDEVTLHRQPTLAPAWAAQGGASPRAERSHRADTPTRVVATLDAATGRVVARRASKISVAALVGFYRQLVAAYPDAERLWVVQDNWPLHGHADVLVALEPQQTPFPLRRPPSWSDAPSSEAVRKWGDLRLPIQLVPLPTYASWLNPIEKLWRWLRQVVGHLHRWADDVPGLRQAVDAFLARFADSSEPLLRYTGLLTLH